MIPQNVPIVQYTSYPGFTYRVSDSGDKVAGTVDGLEAVKQAVYFRLHTERNTYPIYGSDYGVDLHSLIGAPIGFVLPELERRVREALLSDDRIIEVLSIETKKQSNGELVANFVARTVYGDIESEVKVNV